MTVIVVQSEPDRLRKLWFHTHQAYAEWTGPEWSGLMLRSNGLRLQQGPLVQLEMGDRVAEALIGRHG